jgi:hypothetical protein
MLMCQCASTDQVTIVYLVNTSLLLMVINNNVNNIVNNGAFVKLLLIKHPTISVDCRQVDY